MNATQYVLISSTIKSYLSYLKDQNKLKDLFEDYHYLNALNEELNIGVYFDEYTE